jgi:hypothetical protein
MNYNYAVFFKDGEMLTVTEAECAAIKDRLVNGDKFIEVQNNLISSDNIARVGSHSMSAENARIFNGSIEMEMLKQGKDDEVKKLRELKKKMSIKRALKDREEMIALPMSSEETEKGDAEYYLSEAGVKLYS